jgi:replicative DNA helicase
MSVGLKLLTAIAEHGSSVTLRLMDDSYFVDDEEFAVFRYMTQHARRYGRVPGIEAIEEVLRTQLPDTPESVDFYLDQVHKRYVYNGVRDRFGALRNALQATDVDALIQQADAIRQICRPIRGQQQDTVSIAEASYQIMERYNRVNQAVGTPGVPFGSQGMNEETGGAHEADLVMYVARPGSGKCLAPDTPVLMYDGTIKETRYVKRGELMMGPDSKPRRVISIGTGREEMYRIKPYRGEEWSCNRSHILHVECCTNVNKAYRKGYRYNISVADFMELPSRVQSKLKLVRVGVDFPAQSTPIDPYFVGVWIGDGTKTGVEVSNPEPEIVEYLRAFARRHSMVVNEYGTQYGKCPTYAVVNTCEGISTRNKLRSYLTNHCVKQGQKTIPPVYKINSREVRLELLAGILDTDGYLANGSYYEVITKYPRLRDDILYLVRSLGFGATSRVKPVNGVDYYRITVCGAIHEIPCKVLRKKAERRDRVNTVNSGFTIEPLGVGDYFGVTLDKDHLYLLGDFTVTHNTWRLIHDAVTAHTQGYSVVFATMEMPFEQIMLRIACYLAGIDPDLARQGRLSLFAKRLLQTAIEMMNDWNDFHLFAGNFNKRTTDFANVIEDHGPDAIYVDGVYLMKPTSVDLNRINRYERVAYAMDELRSLSLSWNRPIIGTTQFGKGGAKESSLETIGYTDTIATHSTLVAAIKKGVETNVIIREPHLDHEEYLEVSNANYNREPAPIKSVRKLSFYREKELLKNREGMIGISLYSHFRFAPTNFDDCSEFEATGNEPPEAPNLDYMDTGV